MNNRFAEHDVDGITILASSDVVPDRPDGVIRIGLEKFLLAREITVSGAQISVQTS
ncbi:MAG TPA: hypothetical protein PLU81_05770 [Deltaproteobacteria bacterium]|nr:hypothetical protein [Deltaproteobacteria bacterium]HPJ93114.1 hypothetical protein [Deltaproteobacteria bacterium]HPR51275.1 hypothetical protein [Deltaproteobacteria bacterium]